MPLQNEDYVIPVKAKLRLNSLFRQFPALKKDKQLQQMIIDWAKELVDESRTEWEDIHKTTIDAAITCNKKAEAAKRGMLRDKKYAPFRKYFFSIQQQKFFEYQKSGERLSANGFAVWFMKNKPQDITIPYKESNQLHKLIKLAEANNKILKNRP